MTAPAIELHAVTKSFHRYTRRRDVVRGLLRGVGLSVASSDHAFWALKGVTLQVPRGETWGIVGRNGSGKSTLLQIIAGTLQPTSGDVAVHGRVAALLELGSGFHPEFTGRENVFFQGQIQGCSRDEVLAKLDAIIAFAGIGDFLDQPVKTYSSGMMLRLAFAVTITLDPDILIVDEALAVGDEAFQRKCFARIRTLRDQGCTVLFVSHSGQHVIELCDKAMLLDAGDQMLVGRPKEVVGWYHKLLFAPHEQTESIRDEIRKLHTGAAANGPLTGVPAGGGGKGQSADGTDNGAAVHAPVVGDDYDPNLIPQSTIRYPSQGAQIVEPRMQRLDGSPVNVLVRGQTYRYTYDVNFSDSRMQVRFGMMLKTTTGLELGGGVSHPVQRAVDYVAAGATYRVSFEFRCLLQAGIYFANAGVSALTPDGEIYLHRLVDAVMFRVKPEAESRVTGLVDFCIEPAVTCTSAAPL
jgi:lipopolysaccharide transport system ATP-binding protein